MAMRRITVLVCSQSGASLAPLVSASSRRLAGTSAAGVDVAQLSAQSINALAPMFLLHRRMRGYSQHTITSQSFASMAAECGVGDSDRARRSLAEAGYIVDFGAYVHLRPALLLSQTGDALDVPAASTGGGGASTSEEWSLTAGDEAVLAALVAEEAAMREEGLSEPLRRLYKRQRFVWGCALLFCGLQGCVIANLTFTEDGPGWDVMEPVSYFIGCYTSLLFFVFMLRYRAEHSYKVFDQAVVLPKLRTKYAATFDWKRYDALCAKVRAQQALVDRKKAWLRSN